MKLKRWADKQGLNQHEAASRLGISESFLSEVLHGKKTFGVDNALRISRLTGIKIIDLLYPDGLENLDQAQEMTKGGGE